MCLLFCLFDTCNFLCTLLLNQLCAHQVCTSFCECKPLINQSRSANKYWNYMCNLTIKLGFHSPCLVIMTSNRHGPNTEGFKMITWLDFRKFKLSFRLKLPVPDQNKQMRFKQWTLQITDLCLVSVSAGTPRPPPPQAWSPHRSEFAPLEEPSWLVFWESFGHPVHRPMARRDTTNRPHCSLKQEEAEILQKFSSALLVEWKRKLTAVFYVRKI